jgi:hypothetical protein
MDGLPDDLWYSIAEHLATTHELRTPARCLRDLAALALVSRRSRAIVRAALPGILRAMCPPEENSWFSNMPVSDVTRDFLSGLAATELAAGVRCCRCISCDNRHALAETILSSIPCRRPEPPMTMLQYWRLLFVPSCAVISKPDALEKYLVNLSITEQKETAVVEACLAKFGGDVRLFRTARRERDHRRGEEAARRRARERDIEDVARADSRMCRSYVLTGRPPLDDVKRAMTAMRFLHEDTRYKRILRELGDAPWPGDRASLRAEARRRARSFRH